MKNTPEHRPALGVRAEAIETASRALAADPAERAAFLEDPGAWMAARGLPPPAEAEAWLATPVRTSELCSAAAACNVNAYLNVNATINVNAFTKVNAVSAVNAAVTANAAAFVNVMMIAKTVVYTSTRFYGFEVARGEGWAAGGDGWV